MSIIYDADGFAHRTAISNYDRNGYLQPAFDFSKGHVTEDFIKLLKERFFSEDAALVSTLSEKGGTYSMRPAWDEFTDPPGEVYIMIGNGFDIECGLPTSYSDFLRFSKRLRRKDTELNFIRMFNPTLRISFLPTPIMIPSGIQ